MRISIDDHSNSSFHLLILSAPCHDFAIPFLTILAISLSHSVVPRRAIVSISLLSHPISFVPSCCHCLVPLSARPVVPDIALMGILAMYAPNKMKVKDAN
jgi:hypothetical protein